jgi:hypothetical protein
MADKFFDPTEMVRGIQQLLVSDKKKIAFLFGAGTSLAQKEDSAPFVPAIGKMTELVVEFLYKDEENGSDYKNALEEIKHELEEQSLCFNVETILSNIEEKILIIGGGTLNGLKKDALRKIDDGIRSKIREIVSVHKKLESGKESALIQYDFAKWVCNADRKFAVEVFTTNYDYLFEIGMETIGVPYYDGFTGSFKPFFHASSLEDMNYLPQQTKLWKIHGSLGLHEESIGNNKKIIRMNSDTDDLLIYPSSLKYSNSKKQPYAAFMDRLNLFLKQPDAVLFVCGYSFGDEHINERILSALDTNTTAHVFVLFYDLILKNDRDGSDVADSTLKPGTKIVKIASKNRKMSVLASRNAIIGGQYGEWILKKKPESDDLLNVSSFFIEDEQEDDTPWTGKGRLLLPDFSKFTDFLKNMIPKNEWEDENNE